MPELPEVETIRAGLAPHVAGRTITRVAVASPRASRHHSSPRELERALTGRRIGEAVRRGKFLWLTLDEGASPAASGRADVGGVTGSHLALQVHLGMSGQLRLGVTGDAPHLRASLRLDDGDDLTFLDQRTFGYLRVSELVATPDGGPGGLGSALPLLPVPVAHIARDVLDPHLDEGAVVRRLTASGAGVKRLLLDQTLVSGIGNIYADEALWLAQVHPETPGRALDGPAARALLAAVRTVMLRALEVGGTSFDALYVNVHGRSGYFARSLAAYGRTGEACERCATAIVRMKSGGRSTHYCPTCQPLLRGGGVRG